MLTERQKTLIAKCKAARYGWREYALSVEKQGWCSEKQEETLVKMWQRITHAECVKKGNIKPDYPKHRNYCYDSDISDGEAYASGDYF